MTSTRVARTPARAAAMASAPSAPGVNTSTSLPGARRAGTSPAWTSEDLPDPDGPVTTSSGDSSNRARHAAMSASRPKKVSPSRRRTARVPSTGRRRRRPGLVVGRQARVLGEDAGLQRDQLGARIQPELLTERPARGTDGGEGVGLSTAAVLRQREQRPPALAERLLAGRAPCRRSRRPRGHRIEPGLQQVLLGGQPELPEPDGLETTGHPVLQLDEGRTSPQRQRVGQQRDRALGGPGGQVATGPLDLVLELLPVDVELVGHTR